jgi:hypothetical protein
MGGDEEAVTMASGGTGVQSGALANVLSDPSNG